MKDWTPDVTSEFETVCELAARSGGAVLRDWSGKLRVREKGPADFVTEADLASQDSIRQVILGRFPDHGFVAEENTEPPHADRPNWVVDPLDGTTNFVHGLTHYAVSIAVEWGGTILAGAVYDPVSDECFTASRSGGARLNGAIISTSEASRVSDALVAISFPPRVRADTLEVADFVRIISDCQAIRRMGSAALNLCYVACGRMDAYWAHTIYPWDVAAGVLLVREAGGVVTAPGGTPFDLWRPAFVASATEPLHEDLKRYIRPAGGDSSQTFKA